MLIWKRRANSVWMAFTHHILFHWSSLRINAASCWSMAPLALCCNPRRGLTGSEGYWMSHFLFEFFSFWLRERDGAVDPPRAALTTSPPAQTGPTCPCCCSGWTPEQRAGLRGAAAAWAARVKFGREPASKPEVNLRHLHNKSTKDFVILKSITIILNRKIKKQILLHTQRWVEWIEYKKLLK